MGNEFDEFNSWKGLVYFDSLNKCANRELTSPINWHVYLTNACPYSCNFCIMKKEHKERGKAKLSEKTLEKLAIDATRIGVKAVHMSGGGEPLAHSFINRFAYMLKRGGIKTVLSTNGYFLDRLEEPIDRIRVSFNAGTKENYERINNKKDSFKKVIEKIGSAVKRKVGKSMGMGYVITHENYMEIDNFVRIAEDLGVDFVHIRPAYWPEHNQEIMDAIKKINPYSEKIKVKTVTEKFGGFWDDNKYPCKATLLHAVTAATGEFLICQDRLDLRWGDYNTQEFEEIWNSQEHFELMEKAQNCNIRCVEYPLNKLIQECCIDKKIFIELL